MKLFTLIFFVNFLIAQNQIINDVQLSFTRAIAMEKIGDLNNAILLYNNILEKDPNHQPSYFQLKNIYTKKNSAESSIKLAKKWLQNNSSDLQSALMLGEIYFKNKQKELALEIWKNFEQTKLTNKTTYRLLFHTYARLGQVDSMELLVKKGREKFEEPYFFAIDLANYYQSRQTYDRSLREYIILINYQKQYLQYSIDRILVMSDDTTTHELIDSTLNASRNINSSVKIILAGFYYKTKRFQEAFSEHKNIGLNTLADRQRWLVFSENLRKDNEVELSIQSYHYILETLNEPDPNTLSKALLGLGKAYEHQINQTQAKLTFVKWFPENIFFYTENLRSLNIANEPLANTLEHYQSILALLPPSNTTAIVHSRLGQIQARILQDFIGAKKSYKSALDSNPSNQVIKKINLQIGEVLLLSGDFLKAEKYYKPIGLNNINERTIKYIMSQLFQKNIDSPITYLDSVTLILDPKHQFFNDFLEIHDLLINYYSEGTNDDQSAFKLFFSAEALIHQNKISKALSILQNINIEFPDALITPLSNLRLAILLLETNQFDSAYQIALTIHDSHLKDKGLALTGEIEEKFRGNKQEALIYYNKILEECPNSLLLEPIRLHIRLLSKQQES